MCNFEELNLKDVDEEDEIKRYGNTFVNTKKLKETLEELGGKKQNKSFLSQVNLFMEKIELRQATSANNFHPKGLIEDSRIYEF